MHIRIYRYVYIYIYICMYMIMYTHVDLYPETQTHMYCAYTIYIHIYNTLIYIAV